MDDPDVIVISGSSDASFPSRSRPSSKKKRARPPPPVPDDVIEITDSEDELPAKKSTKVPEDSSQAGPSRIRDSEVSSDIAAAPLFLPDEDEVLDFPVAGSSRQDVSSIRSLQRESSPQADAGGNDTPFVPLPGSQVGSLQAPNPLDQYVAQVLEIIPDVDPSYVHDLVQLHLEEYSDKVVEPVLHNLFEDPSYPKVDKGKGKRKREECDDKSPASVRRRTMSGVQTVKLKETGVDYGNKNRERKGGVHYMNLALEQLSRDFPLIPKQHIRSRFLAEGGLYAPTYLFLDAERKHDKLPYKPNASSRSTTKNRDKGKGVAQDDQEFQRERQWILQKLQNDVASRDAQMAEDLNRQECEDASGGIECGCCFSDYPFDNMIQCPDAHLFCTSCMTSYSETLLGSHDPNIVCMDQSGCKLAFPPSQLRRFLTPKLLSLYERVKQQKEIEAAGLENLEECPFCEFKVIIENEQERLFSCENVECGVVSCRACKKVDHLPKTCKEMEEDKKLDARHEIEEAMTRALMRNCPKCKKAFVKEHGCNKMTCPNCHTLSCYVCRKIIKGYDHFDNAPPYNGPVDQNKCRLWDSVEQRHADEVAAAAKQAIEEYKRSHPEVDERDIQVDLPPAPPKPIPGSANAAQVVPLRDIPPPMPILNRNRLAQPPPGMHNMPHVPPGAQVQGHLYHPGMGVAAAPVPQVQMNQGQRYDAIPQVVAHHHPVAGEGPAARRARRARELQVQLAEAQRRAEQMLGEELALQAQAMDQRRDVRGRFVGGAANIALPPPAVHPPQPVAINNAGAAGRAAYEFNFVWDGVAAGPARAAAHPPQVPQVQQAPAPQQIPAQAGGVYNLRLDINGQDVRVRRNGVVPEGANMRLVVNGQEVQVPHAGRAPAPPVALPAPVPAARRAPSRVASNRRVRAAKKR